MVVTAGAELYTGLAYLCYYNINCSVPPASNYGVTIQWTGLLDWNTGLDYWTDIFLVFAHSMVGFMESWRQAVKYAKL